MSLVVGDGYREQGVSERTAGTSTQESYQQLIWKRKRYRGRRHRKENSRVEWKLFDKHILRAEAGKNLYTVQYFTMKTHTSKVKINSLLHFMAFFGDFRSLKWWPNCNVRQFCLHGTTSLDLLPFVFYPSFILNYFWVVWRGIFHCRLSWFYRDTSPDAQVFYITQLYSI